MRPLLLLLMFSFSAHAAADFPTFLSSCDITSESYAITPFYDITEDWHPSKTVRTAKARKLAQQGILMGMEKEGTLKTECPLPGHHIQVEIPYEYNPGIVEEIDGHEYRHMSPSQCEFITTTALRLSVNGKPWLDYPLVTSGCMGADISYIKVMPKSGLIIVCTQKPGGPLTNPVIPDPLEHKKYVSTPHKTVTTFKPVVTCNTVSLPDDTSGTLPLSRSFWETDAAEGTPEPRTP